MYQSGLENMKITCIAASYIAITAFSSHRMNLKIYMCFFCVFQCTDTLKCRFLFTFSTISYTYLESKKHHMLLVLVNQSMNVVFFPITPLPTKELYTGVSCSYEEPLL